MSEQLLTVQEVARRLNVREEYVRQQIRTGRLPAIFLSRRTGYRIRPADLDRFLEERVRGQSQEDRQGEQDGAAP